MIDPFMWNLLPFGNVTAWKDFLGQHGLWWKAAADQIFRVTGTAIRVLPISDGGGPAWQDAVQQQYAAACTALGIAAPPDMTSYNLSKADEFSSFTFLVSQTAQRIRIAAGIN